MSHSPVWPVLRKGCGLAASLVVIWAALPCLRLPVNPLILFPLAFGFYALHSRGWPLLRRRPRLLGWLVPFAAVLSGCLVVSRHLVLNFDNLVGLYTENDFTPLTVSDLGSFVVTGYLITLALAGVFAVIPPPPQGKGARFPVGLGRYRRWLPLVAAVIFAAWLPYFLLYYPGLIYGDSMSSITQALQETDYSNHFPIVYTLFIQLCLTIGQAVGSLTLGCALYTLVQMAGLSLVLGYLVCWLRQKGLSRLVCAGVVLVYAVMSCYPQHAISMWKDPIFGAAVVFYSLLLFDLFASGGALARDRGYLVRSALTILVICLSRNNGVYLVAFSLLCVVVLAAICGMLRPARGVLLVQLAALFVVLILTGPVYDRLGILQDDVESYGIPLQQVARVMVYDGNLTEEDRAFLCELLPADRWAEIYTPGTVDSIKWDGEFGDLFFKQHQKEFLQVWLRTLVRNPRLYFEAWCLSTCGYWAPDLWELNGYTQNLSIGGLNALEVWYIPVDIQPANLLGSETLRQVFSLTTPLPASGLLTWLLLGMMLVCAVRGFGRYAVVFLPCVGNLLTLFVATPISYWPRYTLPSLYLLPVMVLLPLLLRKAKPET